MGQRHAGLEDGGLNLIVFDDTEQLRKMLNAIGFLVDDDGIVTNKGEPVTCSGCGCKLTIDEIGHVMPPDHFYCSNPSTTCIMDYFERYGYPEEKKEGTRRTDIENANLMLMEIIDCLNDPDEEYDIRIKNVRRWVGELQAALEKMKEPSILGKRVLLKPSSDILGTVILGVKWDATGDISDFTLLTENNLVEQKPPGMGGPYCGVCGKDTKGIFYGSNKEGIKCLICCDEEVEEHGEGK